MVSIRDLTPELIHEIAVIFQVEKANMEMFSVLHERGAKQPWVWKNSSFSEQRWQERQWKGLLEMYSKNFWTQGTLLEIVSIRNALANHFWNANMVKQQSWIAEYCNISEKGTPAIWITKLSITISQAGEAVHAWNTLYNNVYQIYIELTGYMNYKTYRGYAVYNESYSLRIYFTIQYTCYI